MARGYPITVRATDSHDGTFDKDFFITVTDVSETPPDDPLPPGEDEPDDPNNYDVPPYSVEVDGGVKLAGKKKSGSIAKFVHDIYAEVPLEAATIYTMKYDPDFTLMSAGGVLAMVGFMFKAGNDFYLVGLRGDGSTGIHAYEVQGDNLWNQTTGFVTDDGGAAANGTQAGPNWVRLETSADGTTITFSTSSDGETWSEEYSDVDITPFGNVSEVTAWGPGAFFHGSDEGPYSILVEIWRYAPVAVLWTPAQLGADVITWWDFSDQAHLTLSGARITAVDDLSPANKSSIIGVTNAQPTSATVASWSNLLGAVFSSADGLDDKISAAAGVAQPWGCAMMFRTGASVDELEQTFGTTGTTQVALEWSGVSGNPYVNAGSGAQRWAANLSASTDYIDITTLNGASSLTRINGTAGSTFNPGSTSEAGSDIGIGKFNGSWGATKITFGEVVFFKRVLTTGELEKIEGYFAHKFSQTALLPGGHPYKTSAPTV